MTTHEERRQTGVYAIRNKANGKVYIGSAARSFGARWRNHASFLNLGKHKNNHLQAAWNKYGADSFEWIILCVCQPSDCIANEQLHLEHHSAADPRYGYNIRHIAGSPLGTKQSPETIAKRVSKTRGLKRSLEAIEATASFNRGRKNKVPHSAEWRAKQSAVRTGVPRPLSLFSDEWRKRQSIAQKGKKRPAKTAEHIAKFKASIAARNLNEELRS